jgi:hypothetical protein
MALQFVVVDFEQERDVLIDGKVNGKTNSSITVDEGTHTFSLSGALNYHPPSILKQVTDTSSINPLILEFNLDA